MTDKQYSIYILGCQSSGKSSFLAGLGIVSEPDRNTPLQLICEEEDRGPVNALANTLRDGQWPTQTTESRFINGTLRFNGHDIPVRWLDYSGERFVQHFTEGRTQFGEIPKELLSADYFLLALDPEVDLAGEHSFDTREDRKDYKNRLQALITAVSEFRLSRGNQYPLHIAALITKADKINKQLNSPQDAEAYLQQTAPTLLSTLREQFPDMPVFAVSAVGHTETETAGDNPKPGPDLAPWGYENIFDWIVKDVKTKRRNHIIKRVSPFIAAIILIVAGGVGWNMWRQTMAEDELKQLAPRVQSEEDQDKMVNLLQKTSEPSRNAAIDDLLVQAERILENPSAQVSDYEDTLAKLTPAVAGGGGYRVPEIEGIRTKLREKIEDSKYLAIKQAFDSKAPSFMQLALDYLASFPNGRYKDEVEELVKGHQKNALEQDIIKLATMGASNVEGLRNIAQGLTEFVANHPDKAPPAMREAARLAIRLADEVEQQALTVELKHVGKIVDDTQKAFFQFKIHMGNQDVYNETSKSQIKMYSFEEKKEFKMPWRPGENIILEVYINWGKFQGNRLVARKEFLGLLSIADLDGEIVLDKQHKDVGYFEQEKVVLNADVKGWETDDWRLLKDWVTDKTALSALAEQK